MHSTAHSTTTPSIPATPNTPASSYSTEQADPYSSCTKRLGPWSLSLFLLAKAAFPVMLSVRTETL